ncbi:MAG: hypothetical protein PVG65_01150, partial [Candidatus Thorarchaeota archaeon]
DEACGKDHKVKEAENELPNGSRPLDEPEEELDAVEKDIAENILINLFEDSAYREYFKGMLKKWKIKSPAQLPPEKRKAFFSAVSKGWNKVKAKK